MIGDGRGGRVEAVQLPKSLSRFSPARKSVGATEVAGRLKWERKRSGQG